MTPLGLGDLYKRAFRRTTKEISQFCKEYPKLSDEEICKRTDRNNSSCVFYGLVGQNSAISDLLPILSGALSNAHRHAGLNALLFTGPPSVGKTTLAKLLSKGLEVPFVETTSDQIASVEDIFQMIVDTCKEAGTTLTKLGERSGKALYSAPILVFFVDEFQKLKKSVMEALLKPLEADDAMLLTENAYVDVRNILWIGATTDRGELAKKAKALDSRFTKVEFHSYTIEEIALIVQGRNKSWSIEDCRTIAVRSGRLARQALQIVEKVDLRFQYLKLHKISDKRIDAIIEVCNGMGIDEFGISKKQLIILKELARNAKGLNYQQLARIANVGVDELKEFVLPPLQSDGSDQPACVQWNGQRTMIRSQGARELIQRGLLDQKEITGLQEILPDL